MGIEAVELEIFAASLLSRRNCMPTGSASSNTVDMELRLAG